MGEKGKGGEGKGWAVPHVSSDPLDVGVLK